MKINRRSVEEKKKKRKKKKKNEKCMDGKNEERRKSVDH